MTITAGTPTEALTAEERERVCIIGAGSSGIAACQVLQERGANGLAGEFSEYTPPYLYLLYLASGLQPLLGPVALLKLLNVPFVAGIAAAVACIARALTGDRKRALLAGGVVCIAPTLLVNAFAWGQSDSVHCCFVLWFVLFACIGRPLAAVLLFGLALSFKLQTMFVSPFLLYLVLSRQVRFRHLLLIPATYLLMMVPAALAGRPWWQLLTIYYRQSEYFPDLSLFAPNPWWFAEHWHILPSVAGTAVGLAIGAAAGLGIALVALRLERSPANNLLVATLSAAVMPWVLPRMHDRYFIIADILTIALAFVWRRCWLPATLFQLGSLTSYLAYFQLSGAAPGFAALPIAAAVTLLLLMFRDQINAEGLDDWIGSSRREAPAHGERGT